MAEGVWKGVYPKVFGRSKQLLLYKSFDLSTPSMTKGRNGGEKRGKRVCFVNVQLPRLNSNIYVKFCTSRLYIKMSSFLFVRTWAMLSILYLSCGVPFPVLTPDNISGLISVFLWLWR